MFVIHANHARDRFAVYSSWRKSYSLSQWMNKQKYDRSVFTRSEFIAWMRVFESLFRYKRWNVSCGDSLDQLFNCVDPLSFDEKVPEETDVKDDDGDDDEEEEKEEEEEHYVKEKTPGESWDGIMCDTAKRIARRKREQKLPLIKKRDVLSRPRKQGNDGDLIWELSFAHSTFDVRNLDRNYRDIVRTARRAHKEAVGYVKTMANESLDEVSDMQQDALDQEHPFGVRCSYSELVDSLYHVPVCTKV